jgi:HK97 family phage portal protein
MNLTILGRTLTVAMTKAAPNGLQSVESTRGGGWWPLIREPFAGAWQRNVEWTVPDVLAYAAVYACVTLIASDIGKLRLKLIERRGNPRDDIWEETENAAYSPVLRKPNHYQIRIKFFEQWIASKLLHGNTYVLKQRDESRKVRAMYVLDPTRVRPFVAPNGDVYYELKRDNLSRLDDEVVMVPATEIIHDIMVALYHPLCGVSPLTACGLAALQGLRIQDNSTNFFANGSQPGGILTAPKHIPQDTADRLKENWERNFSGQNAGRVAVLGDGLEYKAMAVSATDAQLIEQLKWTAENVCTAFHIPPYMIGVGPMPTYNNIEALNTQYYVQALQNPIESIELLIDEGLSLPSDIGVEFDLDQLLRMDTAARVTAARDALTAGMSPNEGRKKFFGLPPVAGGDTPYMQEQNWPLRLLAARELPTREPTAPAELPPATDDEPVDDEMERELVTLLRKELELQAA